MTAQISAVATATWPRSEEKAGQLRFLVAWCLCLLFYFLQYALRSAPDGMIPELIAAFGLTALGVSSLLGLYYYTYAGFASVTRASRQLRRPAAQCIAHGIDMRFGMKRSGTCDRQWVLAALPFRFEHAPAADEPVPARFAAAADSSRELSGQ